MTQYLDDSVTLSNKACPRYYLKRSGRKRCPCPEGRCWYDEQVARRKEGLKAIDWPGWPADESLDDVVARRKLQEDSSLPTGQRGCVFCEMRARDPKTAASVMRHGRPYCSVRCADLHTGVIVDCPSCKAPGRVRDGTCEACGYSTSLQKAYERNQVIRVFPGIRTCGQCGLLGDDDEDYHGDLNPCYCGGDDWRVGDWFQTFTGKMFWILDPRPEDVDIKDIAHSLSMICRFGGHCQWHYSVAQHSVLVSEIVESDDPKVQLFGLLHDAAEAYVGDKITPYKRSLPPEFRAFIKEVEKKVLGVILEALVGELEWPEDTSKMVKVADLKALATEKRDVVIEGRGRWRATEQIEPDEREILPTSHVEAQAQFERRFGELLSRVRP